jgi:hypothetical protein
LRELVDTPVAVIGASDAAAPGMGGVIFAQDQSTGKLNPLLWHAPFPKDIQLNIVSSKNPAGSITNSDLELTGTIAQHDVTALSITFEFQKTDIRHKTVHQHATILPNLCPVKAWAKECNVSYPTPDVTPALWSVLSSQMTNDGSSPPLSSLPSSKPPPSALAPMSLVSRT